MLRRRKKLFGGARFNPLVYSPALWLDASDASTLVMDGARTFASASTQFLNITDAASGSTLQAGDVDLLVSCWVKHTTVTGDMYYISKGNDYALRYSGSAGGKFRWYLGAEAINAASAPVAGTWYHVVGYHIAATNEIGIIIDNGTPATFTTSGQAITSEAFSLGRSSIGTEYLNGNLDSVCVFKPSAGWLASNLTSLVSYLYNSGSGRRSSDFLASSYYTGGNPSGAVSWWDMDARSGNETDRIGSNNLTDNGGVGYAAGVASGLVQYTGDPVKQWSDKSGNARHATATSDSTRPSYATGVQNGLSAILFDAVDDQLDLGSALSLTDQTIFAVVKFANSVTAATVRKDIFNNLTDTVGLAFGATSGFFANERLAWFRQTGTIYGKSQSASDIPAGSYIYSFQYTNATPLTEIWQNGSSQTLTNSSNGEANSSRPYSGYQRIGRVFGDHICELLIFPSVLSTSQRQQVERYLGNKWGITVP